MSFNRDNYHWVEVDYTNPALNKIRNRLKLDNIIFESKDSNIYVAQRMGKIKTVLCLTFKIVNEIDKKSYSILDFMGDIEDLDIDNPEIKEKVYNVINEVRDEIVREHKEKNNINGKDITDNGKDVTTNSTTNISSNISSNSKGNNRENKSDGLNPVRISNDNKSKISDLKPINKNKAIDKFNFSLICKSNSDFIYKMLFTPLSTSWSKLEFEDYIENESCKRIRGDYFEFKDIKIYIRENLTSIESFLKLDNWNKFCPMKIEMKDINEGLAIKITSESIPFGQSDQLKNLFLNSYFLPMREYLGIVFFYQ